jgi:3-phenylpropionate/trans-cinnamate dioxygenase ferredoxin subunit
MTDVRIEIGNTGPYKVTGPIELFTAEGTSVPVPDGNAVYLCRCGGSTNKPFCDGTHSAIGFQGAIAAVADSDS